MFSWNKTASVTIP